jgi:hypothetical protein
MLPQLMKVRVPKKPAPNKGLCMPFLLCGDQQVTDISVHAAVSQPAAGLSK